MSGGGRTDWRRVPRRGALAENQPVPLGGAQLSHSARTNTRNAGATLFQLSWPLAPGTKKPLQYLCVHIACRASTASMTAALLLTSDLPLRNYSHWLLCSSQNDRAAQEDSKHLGVS